MRNANHEPSRRTFLLVLALAALMSNTSVCPRSQNKGYNSHSDLGRTSLAIPGVLPIADPGPVILPVGARPYPPAATPQPCKRQRSKSCGLRDCLWLRGKRLAVLLARRRRFCGGPRSSAQTSQLRLLLLETCALPLK